MYKRQVCKSTLNSRKLKETLKAVLMGCLQKISRCSSKNYIENANTDKLIDKEPNYRESNITSIIGLISFTQGAAEKQCPSHVKGEPNIVQSGPLPSCSLHYKYFKLNFTHFFFCSRRLRLIEVRLLC